MYRRIGVVSTVLLSCMAAQLTQAYGMSDVESAIVDTTKNPSRPLIEDCTLWTKNAYTPELLFTITAIGGHSYGQLFNGKLYAKDVINVWKTNASSLPSTNLKRELDELNTLLADGTYNSLKFSRMVEGRVDGTLAASAPALNTAIDQLMGEHFKFPLFTKYQEPDYPGVDVEYRLRALRAFSLNRLNPQSGGLGNMSFKCIFYHPAKPEYKRLNDGSFELDPEGNPILDPDGFSDSLLVNTVFLAHDAFILPELEFSEETTADTTGTPKILSGDECCCNNSTDPEHAAYYRRCDDNFPKGCTEDASGYCVVGSGNCKIVHHHP